MGQAISNCMEDDITRAKSGAFLGLSERTDLPTEQEDESHLSRNRLHRKSSRALSYEDFVALNHLEGKFDLIEATPSFGTEGTEDLSHHDSWDDDASHAGFISSPRKAVATTITTTTATTSPSSSPISASMYADGQSMKSRSAILVVNAVTLKSTSAAAMPTTTTTSIAPTRSSSSSSSSNNKNRRKHKRKTYQKRKGQTQAKAATQATTQAAAAPKSSCNKKRRNGKRTKKHKARAM